MKMHFGFGSRREFLQNGILISTGALLGSARQTAPLAETTSGRVEGKWNQGIATFLGIPYGDTPAGRNRFMPPRPVPKWSGTRVTRQYGATAPQTPSKKPPPSSLYNVWASFDTTEPEAEDCLVLNIWTPALRSGRRPVMVWLHPGGFFEGSGSELAVAGTHLAHDGDVVVVTINHRLAALGYFFLPAVDSTLSGVANVGQLDQIAALQWVGDNIAEFGGDPDNVTLFGQSGGGAKVCTLMAMPAAHGLFHKGICQSGSYIECADQELATRAARAMFTDLSLKQGDLHALQDLPAQAIVDSYTRLADRGLHRGFTPTRHAATIPNDPFSLPAIALSSAVPLMIGSTRTEATSLEGDPSAFGLTWESLPAKWATWFERVDGRGLAAGQAGDAQRQIAAFRAAYPQASPSELYFLFSSDLWTILNAITIADEQSAGATAPVHLYELDYATPVDGGRWGSPHSLDVPLVFRNLAAAPSIVVDNASARTVSRQMSAAWLAFAHTGNPNNPAVPAWPRYSAAERPALLFDVRSRVQNDYRGADRSILKGIPTLRV